MEVSIKNSPPANGCSRSPTPRTNKPRTMGLPADLSPSSPTRSPPGASVPTICCSPPATAPRSRGNTFRTRVWLPQSKASGIDSDVRVHDLRHATPPGSSPAAPTSSPSWTAWATPRSAPPRNTSTPSPTRTPRTLMPSTASVEGSPAHRRRHIERGRSQGLTGDAAAAPTPVQRICDPPASGGSTSRTRVLSPAVKASGIEVPRTTPPAVLVSRSRPSGATMPQGSPPAPVCRSGRRAVAPRAASPAGRASTGPRPMISGNSALGPVVATIRASGLRPCCARAS